MDIRDRGVTLERQIRTVLAYVHLSEASDFARIVHSGHDP
jgi:hypothetical protein